MKNLVLRVPGSDADQIVERHHETLALEAIKDADIDVETIASYLDIFDRLFLTDNQKPYDSKLRSSVRVKQAEKRHLSDPSLAAALLKATPEMLLKLI